MGKIVQCLNRWLEYWISHADAEHSTVLGAFYAATALGSVVLQGIVILILPNLFFFHTIKIYYSSSSRIKQEHPAPLNPLPRPSTVLSYIRHMKTNYVVIMVIWKLLGLIQSCDKGNGFPFLWLLRKDNNG